MSPTAAIRRIITRADAEQVARKLITLAKAGDPAAVKILLDRCDGPLNGPLATATAIVQANDNLSATVVLMDNHRGDAGAIRRMSTEDLLYLAEGVRPPPDHPLLRVPAAHGTEPPPPPESEDLELADDLPSDVVSGSDFLAEN